MHKKNYTHHILVIMTKRRYFVLHEYIYCWVSITYSEGAFVALGIQHAMRMRHIVIFGLSGSTVLFHLISYTA